MEPAHHLAAIMFTDIVGYTAIMGKDEKKALDLLTKNRAIQKPLIEKHRGSWIKELGDGVMASFTTVSDAVLAALAIRKATEDSGDFKLRIGIHQGEVVLSDNDLFGDAVNLASRIQAIADPGEILVSEVVHNNISNKHGFESVFVKQVSLKNVKDQIRIYRVNSTPSSEATETKASQKNSDPVNSIAVLPFVNMSNDPEQEFFCDGISEEVINTLAQINKLRVISRTSAFSFKGKNLDMREIGRVLDVNTLLEGSVRKAGQHLRITTQLIRVADGSHLWSDRYDRELEDVFAIQEDIARNVATALKGFLTKEEKEYLRRPETGFEAYEYFLKGRQLFHELHLQGARTMFEKSIELDKEYAPAYAGLADTHSWLYEWLGANESDLIAAELNSRKALALAPELAESHLSRAYILALGKKYEEAEIEFNEAIRLNPNSYDVFYLYGRAAFAHGDIEKSAELFLKASSVRLEDYQSTLLCAQSLAVLGKDSIEVAREGIRRAKGQLALNPHDRRVLSLGSVNLYELGEKEEAFEWINRALELYPDDAGVLINAVCLYAKGNQKEKALDLLEKIVNKGYGKRDWIERDPDYDSLRDEPRFKVLFEKLK